MAKGKKEAKALDISKILTDEQKDAGLSLEERDGRYIECRGDDTVLARWSIDTADAATIKKGVAQAYDSLIIRRTRAAQAGEAEEAEPTDDE